MLHLEFSATKTGDKAMAKTYNSIKSEFLQRHVSNMDSGMSKNDSIALSIIETEGALIEYYKSQDGKRELEETAFRHLRPEEAVEMLMQDVRSWAKTLRETR